MRTCVEVHTQDGSFFIRYDYGKVCCEAKLPDGSREIGYVNDIPVAARPLVEDAVAQLHHAHSPRYPAILRKNPWEDARFKLASLNSCTDCPELSS